MPVISYIIADDHKIFRQGLQLALSNDKGLECIGEASDGSELAKQLQTLRPQVVLLDLKMPGIDGVEALKHIRQNYSSVKVLILTMHEDEHFIVHLMEAGANGYLLKNAEPDEIIKALYTVAENEYYFSELVSVTLLKKVVRPHPPVTAKPIVQLNENEQKVLKMICEELTAAEIAREIFLSTRTVEGIRSVLLEKTGARNTAGLVLYAVKNGLYNES